MRVISPGSVTHQDALQLWDREKPPLSALDLRGGVFTGTRVTSLILFSYLEMEKGPFQIGVTGI